MHSLKCSIIPASRGNDYGGRAPGFEIFFIYIGIFTFSTLGSDEANVALLIIVVMLFFTFIY